MFKEIELAVAIECLCTNHSKDQATRWGCLDLCARFIKYLRRGYKVGDVEIGSKGKGTRIVESR